MALSESFLSMFESDPYNLLVILPLAYGYMMGSVAGLRKWIAIQQIPAPISPPETAQADAVVASRTKKIIAATTGLFVFFMAVFAITTVAKRYELEDLLEYFNIAYVFFFFSLVNLVASFEWLSVPLTWHRTLKGNARPVINRTEISKTKKVVMKVFGAIMGLGLPTGVIWYHSDACASVMLFVTVFVMTGAQAQKTNSLRKVIINAIVTEVLLLSYIGLILAAVLYAKDKQGDDKSIEGNKLELGSGRDWVYTFFAAMPLARLFGTALRFDFANHAEAIQSATPIITVEAVPAPVAKSPARQLTTGVKAPSYLAVLMVPFKRCYFSAVLIAWTVAHSITYTLIKQELLPSFGRFAYTGYALLLSLPLMVTALVTVALFRGEAKKMWKYEEVWAVKPVAVEAAVASSVGAATYEDVKEKYEDLVGVLVNVE